MTIRTIHIPLFLFFFFTLFPGSAFSAAPDYLEALITKAHEKKLETHRYWNILLSYKKSGSGVESMIDDPAFFLAPNGKIDSKAEIEATLTTFFQENTEPDKHPRCRFVARYAWLKEQLHIDEAKLPEAKCPDFTESFKKVNPKRAVLVFPASFMNSPASMFGHTLIRLDGDYDSALLSYAISYAAHTDESNGFVFAFKGIFGGYPGLYSILPYYTKVKDYSDLDQRDIWEYELDLTEEETKKLFLHVWELREIYSDYFFFDENCASVLLYLLEAARPSLNIGEKMRGWAIPVDTIKVVRDAGIVRNVTYRPAKATRIRHIISLLDDDGQTKALSVINGDLAPEQIVENKTLPIKTKRRVLDLAAEFTQHQYSKGKKEGDYNKEILAILGARSKLGTPEGDGDVPPRPTGPETGHESGRFSLGIGLRDRETFSELRYRPAYHDLLDPGEGFLPGSQIIFGEVTLRYYEAPGRLRLKHLDVINIVSITRRDRFFQHLSWKVNTGLLESQFPDGRSHLHGVLNPAGGVAFKAGETGTSYLFIETDLRASGRFKHDYAFGGGGSAGIFGDISTNWKAHLRGGAIAYRAGDRHDRYFARLDQTYRFRKNMTISLGLGWEKSFGESEREAKLNWNLYL